MPPRSYFARGCTGERVVYYHGGQRFLGTVLGHYEINHVDWVRVQFDQLPAPTLAPPTALSPLDADLEAAGTTIKLSYDDVL